MAMEQIKKQNIGMVNQADHGNLERNLKLVRIILAVAIFLGVIYAGLGLMVKSYPVPITIVALVLYIGTILVLAFIEPQTLVQEIIVKVVFVVGMIKALHAALTYKRDLTKPLQETGFE
jgi:hypothetical protein